MTTEISHTSLAAVDNASSAIFVCPNGIKLMQGFNQPTVKLIQTTPAWDAADGNDLIPEDVIHSVTYKRTSHLCVTHENNSQVPIYVEEKYCSLRGALNRLGLLEQWYAKIDEWFPTPSPHSYMPDQPSFEALYALSEKLNTLSAKNYKSNFTVTLDSLAGATTSNFLLPKKKKFGFPTFTNPDSFFDYVSPMKPYYSGKVKKKKS